MRRPALLVLLAAAGFGISGYLAAFQIGVITDVWDPFFGEGSRRVLTSQVSTLLPVPDALLGTVGYGLDGALAALVAAGGRTERSATFGLTVIAGLGAAVGIGLAVLQPLVAGAFCTLCLCSSGISVALAVGAATEARDRGIFIPRLYSKEAHE
jgi:hypothetical protein